MARSVETALHKLAELKFDLSRIVSAHGTAPLPPVAANDLAAIGRTNDAILYGARVVLCVTGDDASLESIGPQVPSSASRDHGEPFATIFARYNHDFYAVDPHLFSPAEVVFQNIETGRSMPSAHRARRPGPVVRSGSGDRILDARSRSSLMKIAGRPGLRIRLARRRPPAGGGAARRRRCMRVPFRRGLGARLAEPDDARRVRAGGIDLMDVDGVLVRMMPPGSLEQVVFRMDALHRVAAAGVPVLNPPRAVEAAVDKYLTLALLDAGGPSGPADLGRTVGGRGA